MACKLLQKRFGIKNVSIDKYILKINTHFPRIYEETFLYVNKLRRKSCNVTKRLLVLYCTSFFVLCIGIRIVMFFTKHNSVEDNYFYKKMCLVVFLEFNGKFLGF
jgi:hypothetical protein